MSKRVWNIVGKTIFWCAVVTFFVAAALLRSEKECERRVESVSVIVRDADKMGFITPKIVLDIIDNAGLNPVGMRVDSLDLAGINRAVEEYCFTESALTYVDYSGELTVEVTQQRPVVRICTDGGYDFYLTRGLYVLPVQPHAKVDVPVVTGALTLPFPKGFEGATQEWYDGTKKNHRENYNFLLKLTNFVIFLEQTDWFAGRVAQIVLTHKSLGGTGKKYAEPRVEIVPTDGNYIVTLGKLEDVEAKLTRWRKFTEARVVDMNGGELSVEFDGQALWKAPQPTAKKRTK